MYKKTKKYYILISERHLILGGDMKKSFKKFFILFGVISLGIGALTYKTFTESKKDALAKKESILKEAEILKKGYYVDEAIEKLLSDKSIVDEDIQSKVNEYKKYKNSFVKYEGNIEHIFFHSLMVDTKLAFDNKGHDANGYNMWFATNKEFEKILPLLKENNFVLMNITDIFSEDKNGNIIRNDIYLPEGKKPLVISQDDVNYYDYMKPDGFADKLVIDKNGEVSTLIIDENGKEEITRDGDMVPILDDFVKKNPDFSYKGAKGILAVTGYEGVLGYRLDSKKSIEEAKLVSKKLKDNGWIFASHSYTHNGKGYFRETQVYSNLLSDFTKWKNQIEPVVGKTNVFISPYGAMLEGKNFELAKEFGFDIYCNVSRIPGDVTRNNTVINPRFNIDGYTFTHAKEVINERFFDVDKVMDDSRPPLKSE